MNKFSIMVSLGIIVLSSTSCAPVAVVATGEVGASIAEERTLGHIIDDATIMAKIKNEFAQKDVANLLSKISVTVKEGRVLLTGSVAKNQHAIRAVKIAWSTEGVHEVINELEVGDKDIKTRANDSWIATKIRTKLLFQKGVSSINYTVDVNNGVVYLIGIAKTKKELDLAVRLASQVKGVKEVVSHMTLKSDPRRHKN
ncbi:BON domain-containing protein [Holosporaceae bacterium 'Namur']|nr:BON domain-containing protein [Holosporaceae bacterium 'Namur']